MERYQVTDKDRSRLKPQPGQLMVSGDGAFATLQGEGVTAGQRAIFLRLHGCNLTCLWCDTRYTWDRTRPEFWQEPQSWSLLETSRVVEDLWTDKFGTDDLSNEKRLVVTGGEPLLQQLKVIDLIESLPGWQVEIETNGTIRPDPKLSRCQFNCSPKLENSGNPVSKRYKPEVLKAINNTPDCWFKFVATSAVDLEEIDMMVKTCDLDPHKILVMPEGRTLETTAAHLLAVQEGVERRGWQTTKRNQIEWFGNNRRT